MFTIGSGTAAPSRRRSYVVLVFMTLAAGAMDAVAFLGLGGIFTANMTGNLILLALVGEEGWEIRALRASLACVVFCVGLLTGFGMPKRGRVKERWRRPSPGCSGSTSCSRPPSSSAGYSARARPDRP
ncbi:YoaK family protein [Streptosporangium lutulentum]